MGKIKSPIELEKENRAEIIANKIIDVCKEIGSVMDEVEIAYNIVLDYFYHNATLKDIKQKVNKEVLS